MRVSLLRVSSVGEEEMSARNVWGKCPIRALVHGDRAAGW